LVSLYVEPYELVILLYALAHNEQVFLADFVEAQVQVNEVLVNEGFSPLFAQNSFFSRAK